MQNINFEKLGNGDEYIIMMHDWMVDCSNYELIKPFLNTTKFTYIFADLRGYGLSKNLEGSYTLDEASLDIINLMDSLNINNATILGHSMSSFIAQYILLKYPQRVNKLILVTPIAPSGIKMKDEARSRLLKNVENENNIIENVVQSANKRYTSFWSEKRVKLAKNSALLKARLGYMKMYLSNDFSKQIAPNDISIKVIVGKHDLPAFHKNSIQKSFFKYYKNINIEEIEDSGHYPMLETPILFISLIEQF